MSGTGKAMDRFHIIDDAAAIIRKNGVYRQVKVFRKGDKIYAALSANSFVRLLGSGGTSAPGISWTGVDLPDGMSVEENAHGVVFSRAPMAAAQ